MCKISIIMGIYNVEKVLDDAITSILNQTYQDFELIMCDDGSKDCTYEIALKYAQLYPEKIVLFQNEKNLGLSITLNRCLARAKGTYIARMDGDDITMPERFEKQVRFLDEHPEYAFVSSSMILFDEKGDFRTVRTIEKPDIKDYAIRNPFVHPAVMVRAEAYRAVNGYSEDDIALRVEDIDLWLRLYAAGFRGYNMSEPLHRMREDSESIKRKKYRYRLNATFVRLRGYKQNNMPFYLYPTAFIPLFVGLVPKPLYRLLHRNKK